MFRRSSLRGFVLLAIALGTLFIPLAAASRANRAVQTLTMLAFALAGTLMALTWLILRQRGYVRAIYLGLAALAGGFSTVWLLGVVRDFSEVPRGMLSSRLVILAPLLGVGSWMFTVATRLIFPRRTRGLAVAAIALVFVGVFPAPTLLLQPGVAALNVADVQLQLGAGFLYWTVGAALLVAPFLALATLPGDWFERWWTKATAGVMAVPNRVFVATLLAVTLGLALFFAIYSFDRRATTADEIAQLWHARTMLGGRLALPADPNPEFFAIDNIIDRPRWMSQFPIGGPAVLALGLLFHAVWLLNPILTALIAWNVYRFTQRAYGEAQARAAAAVVAFCPMMLIMGGTYMNHTPTAWLVTLALAALPVWIASPEAQQRRSAAVMGLSIGAAMTIRPLDGVVAGTVIGLLMLAVAVRERGRGRTRSIVTAIVAGAVPVALLLIANWRTTGHPLMFGYEVLWGSNHSLGLHDDPVGNPHTPWRALLLGIKYATQLNWIATQWPLPILLIVAVGLLLARQRRRWDALLLAYFGAQLVVYAFYWHDGQFIGPRFLFTAIPALLILTARAPFIAADRLRGAWWRVAVVVLPVCILVSWLRSMPPFGVRSLAKEFRESRSRLKVDPPRDVQDERVRNALIFVQEGTATRLLHRLWGLGISRADAARLLAKSDGCTLADAVYAEERRAPSDSAGRLDRIQRSVRPYRSSSASPRFPDANFRVSDTTFVTPACEKEIRHDMRLKNTIAYGPMLLLNRFDESGHISGPAIYVMDLGEHNEVLRVRFGNRQWYRYELPRSRPDTVPVLVPYGSLP